MIHLEFPQKNKKNQSDTKNIPKNKFEKKCEFLLCF